MKEKQSTNKQSNSNTKARTTRTAATTAKDFQPHTDIFVSTGLMQNGQVR